MRIIIRRPDPDSDTHAELALTVINDGDVKVRNATLEASLTRGLEYLFGVKCEVEIDFDAE